MSTFTLGVIVFAVFTFAISSVMALTLVRARSQGLSGQPLVKKLLPYIIIDLVFVVVFVIWLLGNI